MRLTIPVEINELQPYLDDNLKVNQNDLMMEYNRLLNLRSQLVSVFALKKGKFVEAHMRFVGLRKKLWKEYKTTNPLRLSNQGEFKVFVDGSEDVREAKYILDLFEVEMEFVENQTKTLDGRIWYIKAEIDIRKFEQGGGVI